MWDKNFEEATVVWRPKENSLERGKKFWNYISEKYHIKIENFWDLHRWSVENFQDFWAEMWVQAGIIYSKPYEKVVDTNISMADRPEWFIGAKMNYAENLLKYRDQHVALIATGEDRETKKITYAETYREACRYGEALKKLGLKKDDHVVCYMPNREEPVYAMLGTTAAGAIWSGALPLLGAKAVLSRFKEIGPKFLFTIDRFVHDGEEKEMLSKIEEIADGLPSLEKVIIVPSKPESLLKDISGIKNSCFLHEFLSLGENEDGSIPELRFEQLSFSHPVFINYTSGTTGNPKVLVHGAGCLLVVARDFRLHINSSRDDCWLSMSAVGWASWNMFTTMLSLGVSIVLYEGVPYFVSPTSLWDLVDEFSISNLLLTPSILDELEKREYHPGEKNHLSSLKVIMCGASVVKPKNFDFVYNKLKLDVTFGSVYGCTEVLGPSMIFDQTLPIHKGEVTSPSLGVEYFCYDDAGNPVVGEIGDVVVTKPIPTLPLFLWGDMDGKRYKETYFHKYHDAFLAGDLAVINPTTKGFIIVGRSDDTLKQRGCRFGSSEIYNVVTAFTEIKDSLCVAQYNKRGDERAVLFVLMKSDHTFSQDLVQRMRRSIERELSKRHVPDVILETKDIPRNLNGKKMEIIVKKVINNMSYNADNLINPECLEYFKDVPGLHNF